MTNKKTVHVDLTDRTINEIADAVHQNAIAHGFHNFGQSEGDFLAHQLMNLTTEVTELHTAWRNGDLYTPCDKADKMLELGFSPLSCIEEEYADIVIRALDQCRRLGVDISKAIAVKHAYNLTRPFKHGDKLS